MKQISIFSLAIIVLFSLVSSAVHAEDLSSEEIVQQLLPDAKTRSFKPNRGVKVVGGNEEESRPTVNLYINFEYDSDDLKQDAKIALNTLAIALKDERLAGFNYLIGGHTDAAGSDEYNLDLSNRRAAAVRSYLTHNHAIDGAHLVNEGFGESRLLDPEQPLDGINRRVQVTNISVPNQ